MLPRRHQTVQVVRVHSGGPAPAARLFTREPDEIEIVPVEDLDAPIGPRRPGERWNRIDDELEVALAGANRVLRVLLLVDVIQQRTPPDDMAVGPTKRERLAVKPSIHAVRSAESLDDLVWTTGRD